MVSYQRKSQIKAQADGKCTRCYLESDRPGKSLCSACSAKHYAEQGYEAKKTRCLICKEIGHNRRRCAQIGAKAS